MLPAGDALHLLTAWLSGLMVVCGCVKWPESIHFTTRCMCSPLPQRAVAQRGAGGGLPDVGPRVDAAAGAGLHPRRPPAGLPQRRSVEPLPCGRIGTLCHRPCERRLLCAQAHRANTMLLSMHIHPITALQLLVCPVCPSDGSRYCTLTGSIVRAAGATVQGVL